MFKEQRDGVLQVRGQSIFALWSDERNASPGGAGGVEATDLYFARSGDGGATWSPDQPIPKGHPPGGSSPVLDHVMAASADGDHVYVLQMVDPSYFGGGTNELWLASSHDAGATFGAPVRVAPTSTSQNNVALAVDGLDVHVVFSGTVAGTPTFSSDLFYLRSTDGGATFHATTEIADDDSKEHYIWGLDVALDASGNAIVAWNDDRFGQAVILDTAILVSRTTDAGATWSTPTILSGLNVGYPSFRANGDDLTLTWWRGLDIEGAFSRDGGATWTAQPIDVSGGSPWHVPFPELQTPVPAYNARYGNAIVTWVADDLESPAEQRVFVGGYRLPEVVPQGFASGDVAHVGLASFSGDAALAWVVLSASLGGLVLPFGDGRNLGLAYDALMAASLANPAVLLAPLDPAGSGASASFALPLPSGTELFAAALSLALAPTVAIDEITDATKIVVE